ncbi:MAG: DNA repair protein RecO [Ignavibacteriae bacterium]|nr:MAG: DNA repair protein RecO [Ignavibacteriota bacterium]
MALVKTEAIILKYSNYRETSKIITFFTREFGKIKCIAKGVRDTKSRWGGVLQSIAHLNIIFYYNENRTLHLISGAEYAQPMKKLYDCNEKIEIGYKIVELTNRTTVENHQHTKLFDLLSETLKKLEDATNNYSNMLFNFEFQLANALGFAIDVETLAGDNELSGYNNLHYNFKPFNNNYHLNSNGVVNDENLMLNYDNIGILKAFHRGNFDEIMRLNIVKPNDIILEKFFERHFDQHLEEKGFSKTKKVIG